MPYVSQIDYATPLPHPERAKEWEDAVTYPRYHVRITKSVTEMLKELNRTLRENLRIFI